MPKLYEEKDLNSEATISAPQDDRFLPTPATLINKIHSNSILE
jgi:hypothetical protein